MENLHQLLTDARGELPPSALDLDRITARGRRRIRRRRWAVVAAVAAVTLAAGSLFPLVRGDGHRLPAHPAAVGLAVRLRGYSTGGYQVGASTTATPGYEVAPVSYGSRVVGSVEVYRPGAFDPHLFRTGTPVTVGPTPGYLYVAVTTLRYGAGGDPKLAEIRKPAVAWPYADDAWAVVRSAADSPADALSTPALLALASHLTLGAPAPMRLPFRLGYTPPGLAVQAAGHDTTPGRLGEMTLGRPSSFTGLTGPLQPDGVTVVEEHQPAGTTYGATRCDGQGCYRGVPGTDLYIGVTGKIPAAELRKVIDAVTTAGPADRAAWFPVAG